MFVSMGLWLLVSHLTIKQLEVLMSLCWLSALVGLRLGLTGAAISMSWKISLRRCLAAARVTSITLMLSRALSLVEQEMFSYLTLSCCSHLPELVRPHQPDCAHSRGQPVV